MNSTPKLTDVAESASPGFSSAARLNLRNHDDGTCGPNPGAVHSLVAPGADLHRTLGERLGDHRR